MITKREIPTLKRYAVEEYNDTTGELLSTRIEVHIPTLNDETEGDTKWIVRHFDGEYVFVYAKDDKSAAIITAEIMLWPIVKVLKDIKTNRGTFYNVHGQKLEYNFRSKEFYLAE